MRAEGAARQLKSTSRLLFELLNQPPNKRQPYVGDSAFAHKGGVHVSAVVKNARTYEHIDPSLGRQPPPRSRSPISPAGRTSLYKAKEWGVDLDSKDPETKADPRRLKELESQGFEFEGAEASFELLMQDGPKNNSDRGFPAHRLSRHRREAKRRQRAASPKRPFRSKSTGTSSTRRRSAMVRSTRSTWLFARRSKSSIPSSRNVQLVDYKVRVLGGEQRHRDQGAGAARKRGRDRPLGHGRGLGQHPRSVVPGAGRCDPLQAFQGQESRESDKAKRKSARRPPRRSWRARA